MYDPFSGKVFVFPAYHRHALRTINFEDFRDALKAINPKFDAAGILSPQRVWRIFRAFVEIALAFIEPSMIEAVLDAVSYVLESTSC